MRTSLVLMATVLVGASACGGSSHPASSAGSGATGGTSGTSGTGSTAGRTLGDGAPCEANAACQSGICGIAGQGNCCAEACSTLSLECGASACDSMGACVYRALGFTCAASSCSGDELSVHQCDGFGNCFAYSPKPCANGFACDDAGVDCNASCSSLGDCAAGSYCKSGACAPQLPAGTCTENDECASGFCGLDGGGNCCNVACAGNGPPCGATGCDATTGDCEYPATSVACGPGGQETCFDTTHTNPNVFCDGQGSCPPVVTDCSPFVCGTTSCLTSCANDLSCSLSGYCDGGVCLSKLNVGPCAFDDECASGMCGVAGTGHCCDEACISSSPCGASDCDDQGQCAYPSGNACGAAESCSGTTEQPGGSCAGQGVCETPGPTDCAPALCGATACLAGCIDETSCVPGAFCDTAALHCCNGIPTGGTMEVDATNGFDTTACCGYGAAGACKTIAHAMALIDAAKAQNVTIEATVNGAGGDWPAAENYPIKLGWGAELNAPGVYFVDPNGGNDAVINVAQYSASDTVGYASLVGTAKSPAYVGMSSKGAQLTDSAAIEVEKGQTLYLANATLNGSTVAASSAIDLKPGGGLMLGEDQPAAILGTVQIGNAGNTTATDGWDGILCETDKKSLGCSIMDATLAPGTSSVVIRGQEDVDILARDFAVISITSAPVVGIAPVSAGFSECPASAAAGAASADGKPDVSTSQGEAIWLDGQVTLTFDNGTVQCISGTAFRLDGSPNGNGNPTLNLGNTTIQNTELGLFASAGTATVTGSTIQFNYNGVDQSTDGTNVAAVDLNGGSDGGANTVICSDGKESIQASPSKPGVNVLNDTSGTLDADNVAWDTTGPDVFSCDAKTLETCICGISSCTNAGGVDDMDAVNDASGSISTTGHTQSAVAVANKCD